MQAAQNHLNQLDMGAFRREIEDVAKRLEGRPDLLAQFQLPWLKSIFPVQIWLNEGKLMHTFAIFFRCLDVPLLQACRQNGENV